MNNTCEERVGQWGGREKRPDQQRQISGSQAGRPATHIGLPKAPRGQCGLPTGPRGSTAPTRREPTRRTSRDPHLTCPVYGIGSGWRTGARARLCCQAPASRVACSGALPPQSPLTDTPGAPTLPALGRKEYVSLVLEHQHNPNRGEGENHMLEVMEEHGPDKLK